MFDATTPSGIADDSVPFSVLEADLGNPSDNDLQRAEGVGRAVLCGSEKGTRIMDLFQRSPIRIMFPRAGDAAAEEAVFVNTAAGFAGGDRLEAHVTALAGALIAVTSQAAETLPAKAPPRESKIDT